MLFNVGFTWPPVAFLCTLEGADWNVGRRRGRMFLGGCDFCDSSEISIGLFLVGS